MTTTQVGEDILSIPTIILAFISIFSCIYVMLSISESGYSPCKNIDRNLCQYILKCCAKSHKINDDDTYDNSSLFYQNKSKKQQSPEQKLSMKNIIFFMCLTDLCQAIQIILNWVPLAFLVPFWNGASCKFLGLYAQFFAIQSPLWHCMLAYNLGYLMMNGSINAIKSLSKQRNYQFLIIIIIPIFSCILPIISSGKGINIYGIYINNINSNDKECWLTEEGWQLGFVIAIILSMIFHWIVLFMMFFKCHQHLAISHQYISIIKKLSRFVIVYTCIRLLPAMERIWECTTNKSPPYWLILSHHICIASVGIANGIVYMINQRDDTKQKQKNNKQRLNNPLLQQQPIKENNHNTEQDDDDDETQTIYTSDITTTTASNVSLVNNNNNNKITV